MNPERRTAQPNASFAASLQPALLVFCVALTSAIIVWPVWPGFMSYDSIFSYRESIDGVTLGAFPPIQAYLFFVFREIGLGTGGVLFAQTFALLLGSALILRFYIQSNARFIVAFLAYVTLFFYVPSMLGTLFVHWKDVTTASFAVLGIGLWLTAVTRASRILLVVAILTICLGLAARSNAISLLLFPLIVIVLKPLGAFRGVGRRTASIVLAMGLVLAYASVTWRLPDFKRLPSDSGISYTMAWDLIGVSACADADFLPADIGHSATGDDLRHLYDPRSLDLSFVKKPGLPQISRYALDTEQSREVMRAWKATVPRHIACYAAHRVAVVEELLGLDAEPLWYPTNGAIEDNPYGLHLKYPGAAAFATSFVLEGAKNVWRRPFVLYILAIMAIGALRWLTRDNFVIVALALGAYSYLAALAFVAPAADGRYLFPSNVFCALIIVIGGEATIRRLLAYRRASDSLVRLQ